MRVHKAAAFLSQAVDIGSLYFGGSVASYISISQVIHIQYDNVGFTVLRSFSFARPGRLIRLRPILTGIILFTFMIIKF